MDCMLPPQCRISYLSSRKGPGVRAVDYFKKSAKRAEMGGIFGNGKYVY
jgi:hypothetical protein